MCGLLLFAKLTNLENGEFICYGALEALDMDKVGQELLLTSQIPSCSTTSKDKSGFIRWTDESV